MKLYTTLLFILFGIYTSFNQCNPPAALDCENSLVLCSLDELDGYTCANPDIVNPTGPSPLCFGSGVPHNTNWWAFVGNGDYLQMVFEFDPTDCTGQGSGCSGIQVGIIDNCGGDPLDCNAACNVSALTLSGRTLNCHTYYVWVDGCCGDVCNYTIDVAEGAPTSIPDTITSPYLSKNSCPCGIAKICVDKLSNGCDASKSWTVDGITQVDSYNKSCIDFAIPVVITPIEVCVTHVIGNPRNPNSICDQATSCFSFLPDTTYKFVDEGEIFVCWEDHLDQGFNWNDTIIYKSCIDPPCKIRFKKNGQDCCADFEAKIELLRPREKTSIYEFVCGKTQLPYISKDGQEWFTDACNKTITWQDSNRYDCDTSQTLFLSIYDPEIKLTNSCGSCGDYVIITADIQNEFDCSFGTLNVEKTWINEQLDTVGKQLILTTNQEGIFYFSLDIVFTDTITNNIYTCNIQDSSWRINIRHRDLTIVGDTNLCVPHTATYSLPNTYKDVCTKSSWYIQEGDGQIIEPDSVDNSIIQVVWSDINNSVGRICVEILNPCNEVEKTCLDVQLSKPPFLEHSFDEKICGLTVDIVKTIDKQIEKWFLISGPGNALIKTDSKTTNIQVDEYGEYSFLLEVENGACEIVENIYKINFVRIPYWTNVHFICDQDNLNYRIIFDHEGGDLISTRAMDSSGWIAISIGTNQFISPWIANNQGVSISIKDKNNCPTVLLDTIFDCMNVAVSDLSQNEFNIYPNPAHDYIHITSNNLDNNLNEMDIKIIDIQGNEIPSPPKTGISGGLKINVKKLVPGMYFIQLKKGDKNEVVKFVKI